MAPIPRTTEWEWNKQGWCPWPRRAKNNRTKNLAYKCWRSMVERCTDPNHISYPNYGGRGIAVDPLWLVSFDAFLKDVGERPSPQHSLDRIENSKNYVPGNVRWATSKEQANNRRAYSPRRTLPSVTKIGKKFRFWYQGKYCYFPTEEEALAAKKEFYKRRLTDAD